MDSPCDKVEAFVDGELPPAEAEAWRHHLVDCVKCQREMANLMQMNLMGQRYKRLAPAHEQSRAPLAKARSRWRPLMLGVMASMAAAVLAVVALPRMTSPSFQGDVWLAERPGRLLEARVSYPGADRHRPLASRMMGSEEPAEDLSQDDLAQLEKRDPKSLVAALLIRDDPDLAGQALKKVLGLKETDRSPDLVSDHAVVMLLKGRFEEALRLLDSALAQNPRHPQALWNRGLVLRQMGLPLLAARDFSEVAALREAGWSEEAVQKAKDLRRTEFERRDRWNAVSQAGEELVGKAKAVPLPQGFSQFPGARRHLYEAVRTAPSREAVLTLLPLAQELDALAGGDVLAAYVRRIADADFSRRAPLAATYAQVLQGHQLSSEEKERFLTALLGSKEDDILLGALATMDAVPHHLAVFEAKAAATGDPWFQMLAAQVRAKADVDAGNWTRAIQTLIEARGHCRGGGIEYRCQRLDLALGGIYVKLHQLELARTQAMSGWKESRARGEWEMESSMLWLLSEAVRLGDDTSQARAFLAEYLERDKDNPETARRVHQALAVMEMKELRVEAARREIDEALATGRTLGIPGVFALADISRLKSAPGDEVSLTKQLEALTPRLNPGERAIATHVLGRFFIERSPEHGRELLWRAIREAEAPALARDSAAQRARAYSFTSLIFEAGGRGDLQEALGLFEREHQGELPRRCLLAASADSERTLFLVRGEDGALAGHYDDQRDEQQRRPLPQRLEGVVPKDLLARLDKCEQVEVLARPPVNGRAGLLPRELAWSYLTRTAAPHAQRLGPAVHLVVSDVELPPDVPLKRLNAWEARFGPQEQPVRLSGAQATPSQVLASMKNATEIDLVAHGIISDVSDASYLLLAPEREGPDLSVSKVRTASLEGAPFVVLAACHAAHTAYSVEAPLSLPAAFIQAGARGVLAATVEIPDLEAAAFFNAVRERMRSGTSAAHALRDERLRWLGEGRGEKWLDSVLLFE